MYRRAWFFAYPLAIFSFLSMCNAAMGASTTLTESISAGFRYDTNARIQPEGEIVDEDYILVISPQLELLQEWERTRLTGAYRLAASYYFMNPDLNNLAHTASVGMNTALSQTTDLSVNDRFAYTKESLEATLTGIERGRASTTSNAFSVSLGHSFTSNTTGTVSLSDTIYRYEGATVNNTRTDTATVGIGYSATYRTSLSASYGFTNIRYNAYGDVTNFTSHSFQAGLGYQPSPSTQLNLSGGFVYTPSITTTKRDWIASVSATKTFEKASFDLGYSRGMTDTSGLVNELNIHETYSARAGYRLSNSFDLAVLGDYSQNHTTPSSTVDLTSYDAGVNGSWRPYSWLTVNAGYTHFEQTSHGLIGSDFKRDNIFVNITATTSRRF